MLTIAAEPVSDRQVQPTSAPSREPVPFTCTLEIELIDANTGEALPGIVQVVDANGRDVELRELLNRGMGIEDEGSIHH
jgi:hypothetical protein